MKNKQKKLKDSKSIFNSSGITLLALIITIIVLLILAVVAVRAVQGEGIIAHAKNAREKSIEAQDKEKIMLALNEWKIVGNVNTGTTFENFMKGKFGDSNVEQGSTAEEVIVTLENGRQYEVKTDGTIVTRVTEKEPVEEPKPQEELISFNIEAISYRAKKEMTWEEWINSEYNTSTDFGFAISDGYEVCIIGMDKNYYLIDSNTRHVDAGNKITPDAFYSKESIGYFVVECNSQTGIQDSGLLKTYGYPSDLDSAITDEIIYNDSLLDFCSQDIRPQIENYFENTENLKMYDLMTLFTENYEESYRLC